MAGAKAAFPWDDVMAIGFGLLRLSPGAFWAMTPIEFERAMSAVRPARASPPGRADLAALMRAFPDPTAMETGFG
ncbi:MAG TPA: rcc01693 family protein [Mesorhizobium sp.]